MQLTAAAYSLRGGGRAIGVLRTVLGTGQDAWDVVRGRRHPDLTPPRRLAYVGGGDFHDTGREFLTYFRELGQLVPDDDVLDIGCGSGRMAVPLTNYLSPHSRYEGFDVIAAGVNWCQSNISRRFPNFHFQTIDAFSERYNPTGSTAGQAYRFPYDDGSFDFVLVTSVFTHLLPEVMHNYIAEVGRVLRPGGRLFATFFLTNSHRQVGQGLRPVITFQHGGPGYRAVTRRAPEVAVGYDEADVAAKLMENGMRIVETGYGTWTGGRGLTYQDVLVASK